MDRLYGNVVVALEFTQNDIINFLVRFGSLCVIMAHSAIQHC